MSEQKLLDHKTFKVVKVVWTDAASIDEWKSVDDLPKVAVPCITVGFLVKTTRQYYYIANTFTTYETVDELMTTGVIMIPRKWVTSFKEIQIED